MTTISFFVPEEPFAKRRPRFGKGRVYSDPQTIAAEDAVRYYARRAMEGREPLVGPVSLTIRFCFETKVKNALGRWHVKKPDLDNLEKLVMDACNPSPAHGFAGVWRDDSQVSCKKTIKIATPIPTAVGTSVDVETCDHPLIERWI